MPTLALRLETAIDGRPLPGRFVEITASLVRHVDAQIVSGGTYLLAGLEGIGRIRALVLTVTEPMTVLLNNQDGFGMPLDSGGLLVLLGTAITNFPILRVTSTAAVTGAVRFVMLGEPL